MRGIRYEIMQDNERIDKEDGMLRLQRTIESYKDFGKIVHDVWKEAFIHYIVILISFGLEASTLHAFLTHFYIIILHLFKVYQ